MTIDPLAVATSGYLDLNGDTTPFIVAVSGYGLIEKIQELIDLAKIFIFFLDACE